MKAILAAHMIDAGCFVAGLAKDRAGYHMDQWIKAKMAGYGTLIEQSMKGRARGPSFRFRCPEMTPLTVRPAEVQRVWRHPTRTKFLVA